MISASDRRDLRAELSRSGIFEFRTARSWAKLVVLLAALGAVLTLVVLLPWWCALLLVPLAAVPAVTAAMIGHEAAHGGFSASKAHNELVLHIVFPLFGGLGAQYWKHKHNLHHAHPNVVGRDPDMGVWPMALSSVEHAASGRFRRWLQRSVQAYLFWPLTLLLAFSMRYDSWAYVVRRSRSQRGFDRALAIDTACLLGHYALWLALPMVWWGVGPVLLVYVGLWATSGLLLALVFAPAHIGLPVSDGQDPGGWQQQLDTTRNLAMPGWLSWFFIGLDYQVEHHLFPRIPHQNLARASRIVERWCAQVGAPYARLEYTSSIRQVTRHVRVSWQDVPGGGVGQV